jgi:hypothetical protein
MYFDKYFKLSWQNVSTVLFGVGLCVAPMLVIAEGDTFPPVIHSVTEDTATITWATDEDTDSMVNYGLDNFYGIARDPLPDKQSHGIELIDLEPYTTYHFRVVSSDKAGNQSVSGDFTFTTGGYEDIEDIERVENVEQQAIVGEVYAKLDEVTDPDALELIAEKVVDRAQEIAAEPKIIGLPRVEDVGVDYAVIRWVTDKPANSVVSFVEDASYDEFAADPYTLSQGNIDSYVLEHIVTIIGLTPATKYHFKVSSEDNLGLRGESEDFDLTTKSLLPAILNVRVVKAEETATTIAWNTTLPAAGAVEYTDLRTGQVLTKGAGEYTTGHTVRLSELTFGTRYSAIIVARDPLGEEVRSDQFTFLTVRDKEPPLISKVSNESTLYPGANTKIQTIVSWTTDEPAVCEFFFNQGLGIAGEDSFSLEKEQAPVTDHVQVVVEFQPSTVYKFWLTCEDAAGNDSRSEDFVLFTPEKEKSIIDIILENFEGTFGWVKNIGK